jgi:lon-related putative ATP-dependent protease
MTSQPAPLHPDQRARPGPVDDLAFRSTAELTDLDGLLGQDRAVDALRFGIDIRQSGYNLFVLGPPGVGKHSLVRQYLREQARGQPAARDWVYVANFREPAKPRAIALAAGQGRVLRQDMQQLIEDLSTAIPSAFETEQYQRRYQALQDELRDKSRQAFEALSKEAMDNDIVILRGADQISFVPARNGQPLTEEQYQALDEAERGRIEAIVKDLEDRLRQFFTQRQQWQEELREKLRTLNREVGMFAVGHLIEALRQKYRDVAEVAEYLTEVQEDVIDNLQLFFPEAPSSLFESSRDKPYFRNYQVNVLVDNSRCEGAPVVYEDLPRHTNLVGRIEYIPQMGTLVTDYLMIRPGALHKANGGYLILDARQVLEQPHAWESLKRALKSRRINIESLGEIYNLISTVSLEPEPVPLDVKVVLVGDRTLYYLLGSLDPDFNGQFKVMADFEETLPRTPEHHQLYARLIATLVRRDGLLDFDRAAVARVIDHSIRLAEDNEKLSLHILPVADLLREADYWTRQAGGKQVDAAAVQTAIDKQIYRADRIYRQHLEEYRRGSLLLDTSGEVVGQVNGLFVIELGNFSFGQPARITAAARLGDGEVVDIEREVELGGSIHSKGVYILSGYLGARYSRNRPLSLVASLTLEQSYSQVEGDSASVGELCALLSVLANLPVRQALAITGSVNQHGQVQPIGGVNEKIEGFFDVCREKGLTGEQGVLIPATNVSNLMLRQEVVDAVAAGQFHIWPVSHVDEAIALLTGVAAGEADAEGRFPADSVNGRVDARLQELAEIRHEFSKGGEELHEHHHDHHDRHGH